MEDFAEINGLDAKCRDALLAQPPEVTQAVVSQGPAEGRNPSAMVMSSIWVAIKNASYHSNRDIEQTNWFCFLIVVT